jgi:molecular chaperone IbpA
MTRDLSIWNSFDRLKPFSIGFNSLFDDFDKMLDSSEFVSNYPPYNIVQGKDNDYKIEVALAGFDKKDISVEAKENTLTIKSKREEKTDEKVNGVLHKGIAQRQFVRSFALGDDIKVKDAKLEKGLLTVDLEREIPEHKKPRLIEVH